MQKGSGFLWALERRGAMQIARILLLAGLDGSARAERVPASPRGTPPRRTSSLRRPRSGPTTLRLVLP